MKTYRELTQAGSQCRPQMLERIAQLVSLESPTEDHAAVNRCVSLLESWIQAAGGRSRRIRQRHAGDLLVGRFDPARSRMLREKPLMLLGHLDTVWPLGTLANMPFRLRAGRAWGPGVLDMKAGIVMALGALGLVQDQLQRPVIFLLNSDEETGSEHSRGVTESLARKCSAVFVLEPAQGLAGAYKDGTQGRGQLPPAGARYRRPQRG